MGVEVTQYRKPQKQEDESNHLGTIGKIGGAIIGAVTGGPQGAMSGAQMGGTAGDLISGATAKTPEAPKASMGNVATSGNSISRRLQSMDDEKSKKLAGLA